MSDFVSDGWGIYVAIATLASIAACAVLLFALVPEGSGDTKHTLELERRFRRNRCLALHDLVDGFLWATRPQRQFGLCHLTLFERLQQCGAGRRDVSGMVFCPCHS